MDKQIVLASSSPRRKQLLELAEIEFEIIVADIDETILPGTDFSEAAMEVALKKAKAVQQKAGAEKIIIAADTIVILEDNIIGKPKDKIDAINILTQLQGHQHYVITGVAIIDGNIERIFADVTEVEFHALSPQQIIHYVEKYKPFDKAGAYAIQEWVGAIGIKRINGDFFNVMGLPVSRVVQELKHLHDQYWLRQD